MTSALDLETSDGFRIFVENGLSLISPYVFLEQETWFEPDTAAIRAFLKPGMRVIDVGANVGYYTLLAASIVGAKGHVWSFEPGQIPARLMRASIRANEFDNVTLLQKAVGSTRGTIRFSDNLHSELSKIAEVPDGSGREVPLESIDALHTEGVLGTIDFIKIDAEGFEAEVIRGADRFFREQSPVVMIEVSEAPTKPPMMLEGLGYQQYRYSVGTDCLVPYVPGKIGDRALNLFMCKRERTQQMAADGLLVTWDQMKANPPSADPALFLQKFHSLAITSAMPDIAALADAPGLTPEWQQAMSEYVLSQDESQDLAERAIRLKRAVSFIDGAYNETVTIAQLLTFCRVWEAADRIYLIAGSLRAVIQHPEHPAFQALASAFLPCSREWDDKLPRNGDVAEYLKSMVMTQYERAHAYSSYYDGAMTVGLYSFLRQTEQATEWVERRAILRSFGDGDRSYPAPIFVGREGTRNREIWQEIVQRLPNEARVTKLTHCVELPDDS